MSHEAILTRHEDGTVTVTRADPVIYVSPELLRLAEPWVLPNGTWTLIQLDTAGEYRYQLVGCAPGLLGARGCLAYERVTS